MSGVRLTDPDMIATSSRAFRPRRKVLFRVLSAACARTDQGRSLRHCIVSEQAQKLQQRRVEHYTNLRLQRQLIAPPVLQDSTSQHRALGTRSSSTFPMSTYTINSLRKQNLKNTICRPFSSCSVALSGRSINSWAMSRRIFISRCCCGVKIFSSRPVDLGKSAMAESTNRATSTARFCTSGIPTT